MNQMRCITAIILFGLLFCAVATAGEDTSKKKNRAQSHLIEARRLAADYKMDKAADKARDALNDNPNLAEAHVYLGLDRLRASDLKTAHAEFAQALEMDPYLASAHCGLGYVLYQEGQLEDATDHWTLSIRLDSTSPQALAGLALSQFKHGQEEEAVRTYQKAITYDRRFTDSKFLESDKGPKWSGQLLQDFEVLLAKVPKPNYP
jgi:tetratricopeptide (TPR) repeat protein